MKKYLRKFKDLVKNKDKKIKKLERELHQQKQEIVKMMLKVSVNAENGEFITEM